MHVTSPGIPGLFMTWKWNVKPTVNRAPRHGVELDEMLPGVITARFAEAAARKRVRELEAKVAALVARHSANP